MRRKTVWFQVAVVLVGMILLLCSIYQGQQISRRDWKIACVGDSITYGSGIVDRENNCYPKVLDRMLGRGYRVQNFGVSGRTAMRSTDKPYVNEEMYARSLEFGPDIVLIMFGTNDSKAYNWKGEKTFKEQYKKLIESYRNLPSEPQIFICTPATAYYVDGQESGPMNYNIEGDIIEDEIVPAVYGIAKEMRLGVIDIHAVTAGHPEWFRADGIHPDAEGAKVIAQTVYQVIESARRDWKKL